jgi:hypothetical protein
MIKTTDHKARAEVLARQLNARLAAEGLGVQARRDRRALAREAKAETTERRQTFEMRRRPSYATVEAQQPFQAETRLIRAPDRRDASVATGDAIEPARRPTFEEMRTQAEDFPPIPGEVREHERRKREQRRTAARVRKRAERDRTKK